MALHGTIVKKCQEFCAFFSPQEAHPTKLYHPSSPKPNLINVVQSGTKTIPKNFNIVFGVMGGGKYL